MDTFVGEASTALLTSQLSLSSDIDHFVLKGDALLVIIAINSPEFFTL
jgi:hypothetical protein